MYAIRSYYELYYQMALTGRKELPFAPDGRAGLEMSLLRMLAFAPASGDAAMPVQPMGRPAALPAVAAPSPREAVSPAAASATTLPAPAPADEDTQALQPLIDEQDQLLAEAERWRQDAGQPVADTSAPPVDEPRPAAMTAA